MIKKIIPLLLLIYVALMPGTRASAPGGVADHSLYPGEKLNAIDTIVLKTPKVLIADPFNAVVELYVRTETPIWGTSNFDDNFIHVSASTASFFGCRICSDPLPSSTIPSWAKYFSSRLTTSRALPI